MERKELEFPHSIFMSLRERDAQVSQGTEKVENLKS